MKPPILLLYGLDETSKGFEVESTHELVQRATAALRGLGWIVEPHQVKHSLAEVIAPYSPGQWLVFNMCEGSPHQAFYYATVARELGLRGYTFTGSDYESLDRTQHKSEMKRLMQRARVPTPAWTVCDDPAHLDFNAYPAIAKPASEHCSYGITRESVVMNNAEARAQVLRIRKEFNNATLIEQFCDSEEYNVSVWGDRAHLGGAPEVFGISMMRYDFFADIRDRLCTFDAKWSPESEAYQKIPAICPAPVTGRLKRAIEKAALEAYVATGVRDYGRVDIRLLNGRPMVLDVNSNCDISDEGGFFKAAHAAGYSYGEMLQRIVKYAIARMSASRESAPQHQPARELAVAA